MEQLELIGSITLKQARRDLMDGLDEGLRCPCCAKYARRYRRPFNSTMAGSLCWLVATSEKTTGGWVHVPSTAPRWVLASNQLPTLRWWGLVERSDEDLEPRLKHHGMWRPTPKGIDFAWGRVSVPLKVVTYDGAQTGYEGEEVFIRELKGKNFDYEAIMRDRGE